ncbi:uncharacterized protein LOC141797696 isoform X2 [Halichoeres trimaculatus]|uniref:uncharacterized protein LOC141797696 isoform X2 n=1 Tax=Halichoeres trimaculatus TaxID=147232 RepID=UPI003D9F6DD2
MIINLGVKALLGWVNSLNLSNKELMIEDLQDGSVLLKVVHMLKKESNSNLSGSVEEPLQVVANFIERDCRFRPSNGTSLSWNNIRDGVNFSVEIAKVLLLLVYHDVMNDRCTLSTLDCDVEREIANLTASYVMESEGYVYLSTGLDAYLARRHLSVSREVFTLSPTTSTSSVSSTLSLSDDESPVFSRKQKIQFLDMHTVASSSVSKSPLQDIMNTPKFQLRKVQRQMIKERDYRDGLERELASKLALIAQRESQINQLQYRLDKLKENQGDQEQAIGDQINELETKNNMLQMRLNEILKENKDFRSNSSLMEHKVDELTEENGVLSSQMRAVCSQLAIFEAEVGQLTETHASAQEEWKNKTGLLESELNQATAQKELLTEQIQILQGKISCLEDEISKATKEEVGENMGPVIETAKFEAEINSLKNELESTVGSLKKAEVEIQAKEQQLADYQQEMTQQKDLLKQQQSYTEEIILAKDGILEKLQKEVAEQRATLQEEIQQLKLQLEQTELQKNEQMARLQQHIATCEEEVEKLKEIKKEKEDLLQQTEQKVKDLEKTLSTTSSLLADKEQHISSLRGEVDLLMDETKKNKDEIHAKEEMLANLLLEKSNEQEALQQTIQTLTVKMDELNFALRQAEQEIQHKQDLLAKTKEENVQQREELHQQIATCEEDVQRLNQEIQIKNEQLVTLKKDSSQQSELLEQEIKGLKGQLDSLNDSLKKAEEQIQAQEAMLTKQAQESSHQKELLQQQLSASEERVQKMNKEIQVKEEQMNMLKKQNSEQSELLHQDIQDLDKQVENLRSSLKKAEEDLQSKENLFAEHQLQSTQDIKELKIQVAASQGEVKRLETEILEREQQFILQKTESSAHSEGLQNEIRTLRDQVQILTESLTTTTEKLQAKENVLTEKEAEISQEKRKFETMMTTTEEEMRGLREQIQTKTDQLVTLKQDSSKQSDMLKEEIQNLKQQVADMTECLSNAEGRVQAQLAVISKREEESVHQKVLLSASEEEVRKIKLEIAAKEDLMMQLKTSSSEQKELLNQEIQDLKTQTENLSSSLKEAEEKLQSKENQFSEQQQQNAREMETLKMQIMTSQEEVDKLKAEILAKEVESALLKTESQTHHGALQQEIEILNQQIKSVSSSLELAKDQAQAKDVMMAKQEQESTLQIEALKKQSALLEEEVSQLRTEIQAKKSEMDSLRTESCNESQKLHNEIQTLRDQVQNLHESLKTAEEQVQTMENLLTQKDVEISEEKSKFENMLTTTEEDMRSLREQIKAKEDQLVAIKQEGFKLSDMQQQELQCLKNQLSNMQESLTKAEERVNTQQSVITKQEEESAHQKELLLVKNEEVRKIKEEIQTKEDQVIQLKTESSEQSASLHQEITLLQTQVETLGSSLSKAEEATQLKEELLAQQQQENTQQKQALQSLQERVKEVEILQGQIISHEEEIQKLKESKSERESLLLTAERQLQITQAEFSAVNALLAEKDQNLSTLKEEVAAQANLVLKAKQESEASEKLLIEIKEASSIQTVSLQREIQDLKEACENISHKLLAKEQMLTETQRESSQQTDLLQKQLVSLKTESQAAQELQVETFKEKEGLMVKVFQLEKDQKALEKQLEASVFENERLTRAIQATERENIASSKLESALHQKLELLKVEKEREIEMLKRDLQGQLSAKSEAVEHYKAQMEKAYSGYNSKKQLLQESQGQVAELKNSLEVREREVKAVTMENKILQLDLEKAQTNEKKLSSMVASLEAQLAFADRKLRAQDKIHGNERSAVESMYLEVPGGPLNRVEVKRALSSDSLDQSSLEDSLNNTRKISAPDESSTPLVRSSERLAAKRRGLQAESLETLYFTPINNRTDTANKMDSSRKNPTSSVKRRRTTQVINITMTKKTPGGSDGDESFFSLASTRSQPNLSSANSARPVSAELFDTPARMTGSASDQLIGLPGYRRSTINSQPTSTFCVGAENEPESGPDDWMRIAELQARNKACLPHLKSSYPVESEVAGFGGGFRFTDEELRMGDPSDTIRRASMLPGQLHDSLASHRYSLAPGRSSTAASTYSNRLSLMPGQLSSKAVSSSQLRSPKGSKRSASTLTVHQTSPEKKVKASCFPRPLTPKNRNVVTGPSSSQLHPALSPADRRQSMMFTIDNTPKNSNYLKKGLNKLRSSTRKSPGKNSKKSPAQKSAHRYQENITSGTAPTMAGRAGRFGSSKSPQAPAKGLRKSPRANSMTGKSPGLTSSARKMMRRMKV